MTKQINLKIAGSAVDKAKRYGWIIKDTPGELLELDKNQLQVDETYQRDAYKEKVLAIARTWSWISAGVIVVAERNGEYFVIDGQHRVVAANQRKDIEILPCIVFKTETVKQEAMAFLNLNTNRKPVSSIGKFRALVAAEDPSAAIVQEAFQLHGITAINTARLPKQISSISWALKKAKENPDAFRLVLSVADELCKNIPLQERLLDGLWYINERFQGGISEKRLYERLHSIGAERLIFAANKAAAYFSRGGAKVWANGMLDELNKGMRYRFELNEN